MGPKKKGKKPKKTKEELEADKRAREEEEVRLKAEEEKRLEEERIKREEEERLYQERQDQLRQAELERLQEEFTSYQPIIEDRRSELDGIQSNAKRKNEWKKYLECDPRPDATLDTDINFFRSVWSTEEYMDLENVIQKCSEANHLIEDLTRELAIARAENDADEIARCKSFISSIKKLIGSKIDSFTAHLLQYADEFTEKGSKHEVKVEKACEWVKLGIWVNLIVKGFRSKRIEFPELNIIVEIPKAVTLQNLAVRLVYLPFDSLSTQLVKQISIPLGGVFSIDLLSIPPHPKKARGWTMREIINENEILERVAYPLEGSVASAVQSIKVQMKLPDNIVFQNNPRVGYFDDSDQMWKEDGISEIQFAPDERMLQFHTIKLTSLAILQERDSNFVKTFYTVYTDLNDCFSIEDSLTAAEDHLPKEPVANFILGSQNYKHIHIVLYYDGTCGLVEPSIVALKELNEKRFQPGELLEALASAGINLMPQKYEDKDYGRTPKDEVLENVLEEEVARVLPAFEVSSYDPGTVKKEWKSNYSHDTRACLFKVKERHSPNTVGIDPDYELYHHVLAVMDDDCERGVKFILESAENKFTETHVYLKDALERISTPNAMDVISNSSVVFEDALRKILKLLRPFSYCLEVPDKATLPKRIDLPQGLSIPETAVAVEEPEGVESTRENNESSEQSMSHVEGDRNEAKEERVDENATNKGRGADDSTHLEHDASPGKLLPDTETDAAPKEEILSPQEITVTEQTQ